MRAIVLSGGGNLGPAQVGALRVLIERGIVPDMIVGCSAGALNAAFLARDVSLSQLDALGNLWRDVTRNDIYPGNRMGAIWRFVRGKDSLYDNRRFFAFLQHHGTTPALTFGDNKSVRLYVTATHVPSGNLHVFGDNPGDRVLDAVMSSTALTPMLPPWEVQGERYIDGGTITPLPLRVALDRGAKEIFALHIISEEDASLRSKLVKGITAMLTYSVSTMLRLQAQHDLVLAEAARSVKLHYIPLRIESPPETFDFSQAERLINLGYAAAEDYFNAAGMPRAVEAPPRWRRFADRFNHKTRKRNNALPDDPRIKEQCQAPAD